MRPVRCGNGTSHYDYALETEPHPRPTSFASSVYKSWHFLELTLSYFWYESVRLPHRHSHPSRVCFFASPPFPLSLRKGVGGGFVGDPDPGPGVLLVSILPLC